MRRNPLFWGSLLVLAGILFLLSNLEIIHVNVWDLLWPVFLIVLGISFLWGVVFRRPLITEHANVPLEGARQAQLKIQYGAGKMDLRAGAGGGDLVVGDFAGGVAFDTRKEGDLLRVRMSTPRQVYYFWDWPGYHLDWSFTLARDIPLSLKFETGATEAHIDLSELLVTDLQYQSGASSTDLTMPANSGFTRATFETGAASVRVRIPSGVAARIRTRTGISSVNVDSNRFPRMGDVHQSPDFESAANKVEIDFKAGVGSIEVS